MFRGKSKMRNAYGVGIMGGILDMTGKSVKNGVEHLRNLSGHMATLEPALAESSRRLSRNHMLLIWSPEKWPEDWLQSQK